MASRIRGRKIVDAREEGRPSQPSGEGVLFGKDGSEQKKPRRKRRKIVSPRKEEHKYIVPWAIVE